MRYLAFLTILLATACSSKIGNPQEGATDARPIDFRDPPEPKEGSGTSPGCEGVTARGECQQGSAVYCDLDRGRLRRVDCEALGQNCILDISRGAICKSLEEQDTGAGSGAASQCSDTGISEKGFCTSAGEAVYCDTSGTEAVTRTWDCSAAGKTCGVDSCADGAFCCGEGTTSPEGGMCAASGLDFDGVCEGDTAKWCSETSGPQQKDCSATGQRCEVDTCATGAYCCGAVSTTGNMTPEQECAAIGFEGICLNDTSFRYCSDGALEEVTCFGATTCQVDACFNGAGCCAPAGEPVTECEIIGFDGICEGNTLKYCVDEEDGVEEELCGTGTICEVDDVGFAECVEEIDPCADLGFEGICADATTLHYCIGDELTVVDCTVNSVTCEVDGEGYADCE
tara:strand:+ start:20094 stop:21287 length:1194 start_codon:yes stop_codon:yes gene_type:complete